MHAAFTLAFFWTCAVCGMFGGVWKLFSSLEAVQTTNTDPWSSWQQWSGAQFLPTGVRTPSCLQAICSWRCTASNTIDCLITSCFMDSWWQGERYVQRRRRNALLTYTTRLSLDWGSVICSPPWCKCMHWEHREKKHVSCCPAWLKTLLKENSSVFYDIPTWWHAMHSERTVRHCLSVGYQRKIINSKHLNLVPKRFPNDSSDVLNCTIDPWFGNNSSTWKQSCNYESFLSNKPRISPGCGLKHSDQVGKRPYLPWIANKVIEQHLGNWFIV